MCYMKTDAVTRHFIEYNAQIKIRFCPPIKNSFQLLPKGNIHFENRQYACNIPVFLPFVVIAVMTL